MSGINFLLALEETKFVVLCVPFRYIREAKLNLGFWLSLAPESARGGGGMVGTGKASLEKFTHHGSQVLAVTSTLYVISELEERRMGRR